MTSHAFILVVGAVGVLALAAAWLLGERDRSRRQATAEQRQTESTQMELPTHAVTVNAVPRQERGASRAGLTIGERLNGSAPAGP